MRNNDTRHRVRNTLAAFGHEAALSFFEAGEQKGRGMRGVDFYGRQFPAIY